MTEVSRRRHETVAHLDILDARKADLGHEASGAPTHKAAQLSGS